MLCFSFEAEILFASSTVGNASFMENAMEWYISAIIQMGELESNQKTCTRKCTEDGDYSKSKGSIS